MKFLPPDVAFRFAGWVRNGERCESLVDDHLEKNEATLAIRGVGTAKNDFLKIVRTPLHTLRVG